MKGRGRVVGTRQTWLASTQLNLLHATVTAGSLRRQDDTAHILTRHGLGPRAAGPRQPAADHLGHNGRRQLAEEADPDGVIRLYTCNNADQVTSATTPSPGAGMPGLTALT
jgi:YD repeat-containing protein